MSSILDDCTLNKVPSKVQYIANFISDTEENEILNEVNGAPKPKWTCLSHRRLQNWGGVPHPKGMIAEPIPKWLQLFMNRVEEFFPVGKVPNHVLVNEYPPGVGIMPHTDGPLFYPVICTITCGSHTVLNFQKSQGSPIEHKLLLERRSLVVVSEDLYHNYLHSIADQTSDFIDDSIKNFSATSSPKDCVLTRATRVSLTIRHVPATTKFKLKLAR